MKKYNGLILGIAMFALGVPAAMSGCSVVQGVNAGRAMQAGMTAYQAASITDAQVVELCRASMVQTDAENTLAPANSPYAQRLARLTGGLRNYDGLNLNFAAYVKNEVNAFASGDGSVRVYSGLMDVMDDDQLMAILGHEIGHVKNQDTKDQVKNAYVTAAAREGLAALDGRLATLTDSMLGDIAQSYLGAQYSQRQENEADAYGFGFTVAAGRDPYAMARSMEKLLEISGTAAGSSGGLMQAFSSHPDTAGRERRMRALADAHVAARE
ncbi:MAG: M48 family metallopeptidase [Alistipes sp.]|jgi:putative metalloprotease|nr:M48 family metallopeptidase [Alistipes sp.]